MMRNYACLVGIATSTLVAACTVDGSALGPVLDAGTGGASGTAVCPAGITNQANWPVEASFTSCAKPCGPDSIGIRFCSQTDRNTCQATSGCVCLESPCVDCANCGFFSLIPDCYVPTNAATAPPCANGVTQGGTCAPACSRLLCLEADGKTACVCNAEGRYACATWGETTWK